MKSSITRRLLAAAVASTLATGGLAAASVPASAAFSDCPVNYICLWEGMNATGRMVFRQNGSWMSSHGKPVSSPELLDGSEARSSNNRTLGRFCTFHQNLNIVTNYPNAGTAGNLASRDVYYVQYC